MGGDSSLGQLQPDYDTWYSIYQKINSTTDQNFFGLTCVTFRHIQNSSCKSLKLRCRNFHSIIDSSTIHKLLNRHTQLETLTLGCHDCDSCEHVTYSCLTPLQKYGSTLHSLYLDRCVKITDIELIFIASACRLLSVISLSFTSVSDPGLKILSKSCKFLKDVNLVHCESITDNGVFFLNQNCRQLRSLRVSCCRNITGVGFKNCSPTLACLDAYECNLDSRAVSRIVSGGDLECLNIGVNPPPINYERPLVVFKPDCLTFASKLKYLNVSSCSFADDDVIVKISRGCPLLQEWNLTDCNTIGITGWESIGLYCQNLETIHVGFCVKLCDRGLLCIVDGCKRLSVIYIEKSRNLLEGIGLFRLQREDVEIKPRLSWKHASIWAFKAFKKFEERGH
ncbi:F-box/LRR-repeat protein 12-like [Rutidosis leptorrhynchoides]|uniref:F-box/LRR-repeat protein 12-like n=1 Tax=Rutidosis leptorrhynchoides TaxID=125765 RepID=UPI003A994D07